VVVEGVLLVVAGETVLVGVFVAFDGEVPLCDSGFGLLACELP